MLNFLHKRLQSIAEVSGIMVGVLVFLAIIRVYVHYQYYHINIVPYLDFSEVILSIFSDLKVLWRLLVMLTGNVLLVPLVNVIITAISRKFSGKRAVSDPMGASLKWRELFSLENIISPKNNRTRLSFGILGAVLMLTGLFRFFTSWATSIDDATFYISTIVLSLGLFCSTWGLINHFARSAALVALVLFFFIFILLGKHDPTLDQQNALSEHWTLITASDTIVTNDSFYVAGKTNHYYFLYERHHRKTTILPVSEIKSCSVEYIRDESNRLRDILEAKFNKMIDN